MYVITDHNNGNFVILGPIEWKPRYISDVLSDELDQDIVVTREDEARVPFEVIPGVKVRKCTSEYATINPKIHRHEGPFWSYDDANTEIQAIAAWEERDKPIEEVKANLRAKVADLRWKRELVGVTLTIQSTEVWCDTSRGNRDIFLQKYTLMGDNDIINWKFPGDIWLNLTKTDLGYIVSEGATYIQTCFDWEANEVNIINNCADLAELDALVFEGDQPGQGGIF